MPGAITASRETQLLSEPGCQGNGSVKELVASMKLYLAGRNLEPVRYEWKAEGAAILEKIKSARAAREITKVSNV